MLGDAGTSGIAGTGVLVRHWQAGNQPAVSPVRAFGERYGKASERGVPEIAILAGTGFLASGKVCKEAKASLVVQPYGSASSPSLAASCAISPVWARSCGTGKRAGRAKPAGASEASGPSAGGIAGTGVRGAVRHGKRAGTPRISAKKHDARRDVNGGKPVGGPVDGATRRAPLLNAGRPRNRHPRRYRRSRFWKGLERSESVARGPALRVGFFAVAGGFLRNLASTGALVRHWQASGHTTLEKMLYTFRVRQTRGNRRGNALHLQVICTNNDVSHAASTIRNW